MKKQRAHASSRRLPWPEREKIITREGKEVDASSDVWRLPYSSLNSSTLNFIAIINPRIRSTLKDYVVIPPEINRIQK